jgi:hypothetical protein
VLAGYLLLGLILTWPLVAHLATHVPGDGIDDPSLAWNLWWVKHALVDLPQNPFISAWQFWPIGINLAFYTLTVLNGMLGIPLVSAFGVIPAYNLLLLSSFVLGGYGAYLLALDFVGRGRWTTDEGRRTKDEGGLSVVRQSSIVIGPFLAGALYAFASSKLFYAALGQGNIASSQWVPFAALYIVRAARPGGKARDAALAALFLALQAYAEMTYASFLLVFAGLAFVWGGVMLVRRQRDTAQPSAHPARRVITRYVARFTFLAVLFALAIVPLLANMLPDLRAEGDFLTSGGGFADIFSADLAGYAVPTQLHPLLGGVIRAWSHDSTPQPDGSYFAVNKGQQIYLGYVALALAVVGAWRGRRRGETWFWVTSALLFFVLTLGPNLRIAGHDTGIPLPFRLLEQLPFFKGNRYPSRYSVMLMMSVAPLVAAGAYGVLRVAYSVLRIPYPVQRAPEGKRITPHASRVTLHASRFTLPVILLALLLFEHLSAPLPMSDLRVPAIYARVAAGPGDFALLELPPGWRNGARVAGKQDVVIMSELWNQTSHGKRVLGGNTSRNPEFKFQYFSEDPTLARLIALTNAADLPDQHSAQLAALAASPVTAEDRARARELAAFLNLRYVMVHRDKLSTETEAALRELLPVELVSEEGNLALYRITEALAPPRSYTVGTDQGRMALAEGWSPPAPGAGLADDGSAPPVFAERRETRLLLPLGREAGRIRLHGWSFAPDQQVTLVVDGRETDAQVLPEDPTWLTFDFPADPDRPPLSDVRLRFAQTVPYREWAQRLDGVPVSLLVRSAGQETGDFGHIYADGEERSLNRRGYNLVAVSPDGRVLDSANFDTHADPAANTRLAEWVAALPTGTRVAGAVRDEASMNLTQEGVDALHSLGVGSDLRGHFRWGHAFIGQKGDAVGAAREAMDGVRPVQLSFGLPLSATEAAAAVDTVEVR